MEHLGDLAVCGAFGLVSRYLRRISEAALEELI